MKARFRFFFYVAAVACTVGFSVKSDAQCDFGFDYRDGYGGYYSFDYRGGHGRYDHHDYYESDWYYYDDSCDYRRGRYDRYDCYEPYDRGRNFSLRITTVRPERREIPQRYERERVPRRSVNRQYNPPQVRRKLPGYVPEPKVTDSGKAVREELVSPYQKKGSSSEKTFPLELPVPAPRQNRKAERIPPPSIPQARKTPNQPVSPKVGNAAVLSEKGDFPIDLVIANSDDEFTTVREVMGQNKAVLIDFWASWCGPCIQSMPELKQRSDGLKDVGVVVAGMNVESDVALAKRIQTEQGMNSVVWLVEPKSQPFSEKFDIKSIPQVMLVRSDGTVLFQGYPNDRKLDAALDALAQEN